MHCRERGAAAALQRLDEGGSEQHDKRLLHGNPPMILEQATCVQTEPFSPILMVHCRTEDFAVSLLAVLLATPTQSVLMKGRNRSKFRRSVA